MKHKYFSILTSHFPLQKGFTLIELLTVFSIIGILTAGSFAAFNKYSDSQTLSNARADVFNMIQTAKSRAQSQVKPSTTPCDAKPLYGYVVTVTVATGSYTLSAMCKNASDTYNTAYTSRILVATSSLPSGISFNASTTTTQPTFEVISGNVTNPGQIVIWKGSGTTKTITISNNGTIQ